MASSTHRETAKIYQFPARPGITSVKRRPSTTSPQHAAMDYADCASGGAWYHEEAIAKRETTPKLTPNRR